MKKDKLVRISLIFLAVSFIFIMLVLPLLLVAKEALAKGFAVYANSLTEGIAVKAMILTLEATVAAVLFNTIFGVASAWLLTKYDFKGKTFLASIIDLRYLYTVLDPIFFKPSSIAPANANTPATYRISIGASCT